MPNYLKYNVLIFVIILFTGCNTMQNIQMVNFDILEPADLFFNDNYKNIALRYNNANVSYNENFARYSIKDVNFVDGINNDSILSVIYFRQLVENLNNQAFFKNIAVTSEGNFSNTRFIIPAVYNQLVDRQFTTAGEKAVDNLSYYIKNFERKNTPPGKTFRINPLLGLYTWDDLTRIKNETGADLLFSLDFFATHDEFLKSTLSGFKENNVYFLTLWNIYDLQHNKLVFNIMNIDTVSETIYTGSSKVRKADFIHRNEQLVSSTKQCAQYFSNQVIPHWEPVERTVYYSFGKKLKKATMYMNNGQWDKAAEIWEKNTESKKKIIAAQSAFNLAVACEMKSDFNSAFNWVIKSANIYRKNNEIHEFNCKEYLRILNQRKEQAVLIRLQMNDSHKEVN